MCGTKHFCSCPLMVRFLAATTLKTSTTLALEVGTNTNLRYYCAHHEPLPSMFFSMFFSQMFFSQMFFSHIEQAQHTPPTFLFGAVTLVKRPVAALGGQRHCSNIQSAPSFCTTMIPGCKLGGMTFICPFVQEWHRCRMTGSFFFYSFFLVFLCLCLVFPPLM